MDFKVENKRGKGASFCRLGDQADQQSRPLSALNCQGMSIKSRSMVWFSAFTSFCRGECKGSA